jgi:hypothetical protein
MKEEKMGDTLTKNMMDLEKKIQADEAEIRGLYSRHGDGVRASWVSADVGLLSARVDSNKDSLKGLVVVEIALRSLERIERIADNSRLAAKSGGRRDIDPQEIIALAANAKRSLEEEFG